MLALPPERIRFVTYPESTLTANLVRDGRLTLTLAFDGAICELLLHARALTPAPDVPLAMFEATLDSTRVHRAPYADVLTGVTFAPHEPHAVLARWDGRSLP